VHGAGVSLNGAQRQAGAVVDTAADVAFGSSWEAQTTALGDEAPVLGGSG
jgi:hypothetical protein